MNWAIEMHHLDYIGYQRFQPAPKLRPYVQCYWAIRYSGPVLTLRDGEYMHPDAGVGLIINFANSLHIDHVVSGESLIVKGPTRKTARLFVEGDIDALGIQFKPGMAYPFLGIPLFELANNIFLGQDLSLPDELKSLSDMRALGLHDRLQAIEGCLMRQLTNITRNSPVQSILENLDNHPLQDGVSNLSEQVGLRQLERQFRQWVGLTPKQVMQLYRLRYARSLLRADSNNAGVALRSLTDVAYSAGYYDQAHFVRKFNHAVGLTPGQYKKRLVVRKQQLIEQSGQGAGRR